MLLYFYIYYIRPLSNYSVFDFEIECGVMKFTRVILWQKTGVRMLFFNILLGFLKML